MSPKIPDESPTVEPAEYSYVYRIRWVPCGTCAATGLRQHLAFEGLPQTCPTCGGFGKTVDFVFERVERMR